MMSILFYKYNKGKKKIEEAKKEIKKTVEKIKKETGLDKTTQNILPATKMKHVLLIKSGTNSFKIFADLVSGKSVERNVVKGDYCAVDENGIMKYFCQKEDSFANRTVLGVYDATNQDKIGSVKEWIFSVGNPLYFEKDVKKCSISWEGNLCDLKKYVDALEKKLEFETLKGNIRLRAKVNGNISISYKQKKIAELHKVNVSKSTEYTDKYVLEYEDLEYEKILILVTIAICVLTSPL